MAIWTEYHNSWSPDPAEFVDRASANIRVAFPVIGLTEVDGVLRLLRSIGHGVAADTLLGEYLELRGREWVGLDWREHALGSDLSPETKVAVDAFRRPPSDDRSIVEILSKILETNGWSPVDVERLKAFTADDYYQAFRNYEGGNLAAIIGRALDFMGADDSIAIA